MMKDSGIAWIGIIPGTWNVIKFKYVFSIEGGNGFPDSLQGNTQGDYPFCKVSDINGDNDYVKSAANWVTQKTVDSYKFNVIPPYSILMAKIGAALAKNHRKINTLECCIDNNTQALILKRNDSIRYLFYLSKCLDMSWFDNNSTVPSINNTKLLNSYIPNIPHDKQEIIAGCLDIECTRIDAVIEQTRTSIEEYKKLKQAVITQAVTKGIRPNRPMKDSGVDWIENIPSDWQLSKIKHVCTFQPWCDITLINEDTIITYTPMDCIKNGYYINNTAPYGKVSSSLTSYSEGDIVMAKVTPCFENGNIAIMENLAAGFGLGSSELFVFRPRTIDRRFLFYWLRNDRFIQRACSTMTGTGGLKRVSPYFMENCDISLPPADEQKEIVAYLDEKIPEIDALIDKKEKLISELESYKKSMIYEYVTGKKEVVQ